MLISKRLVAVFCVAVLIAPGFALKGDTSFDISTRDYVTISEFGFMNNGTYDLKFSLESKDAVGTVWMYGLYYDNSNNAPDDPSAICNNYTVLSSFADWFGSVNATNSTWSIAGSVDRHSLYLVVVTSCTDRSIELGFTYNFMNPGGEALSTTQIPFKTATLVMAGFWAALGVAWILNRFRNSHLSTGLHSCLGFLAVLGVAKSLSINRFWEDLSSTGEVNRMLLFSEVFLSAIASGFLVMVFMLVATGWCISRVALGNQEWGTVISYVVFYCMCDFGWEAAGSLAFAFLLAASYLIIIFFILKHSRMNLEMLYMRVSMSFDTATEEVTQRLMNQFNVIRKFRSVVLTYICFVLLSDVWGAFGLRRLPWAVYCIEEIVTLVVAGYLLYLLRLSRQNVYAATLSTNMILLNHDGGLLTVGLPADMPGALTAQHLQQQQPQSQPMIVVSNPGSIDTSGNALRDLMVARPAGDWSQYGGTVCAPPTTATQLSVPLANTSAPQQPTAPPSNTAPSQHGDTMVDVDLDESEHSQLLSRRFAGNM